MKITMKEVSKLIKNLIWVFCISLVAFYFIKIPIEIYCIIVFVITIYIVFEYSVIKNRIFYIKIFLYIMSNMFSFFILRKIENNERTYFMINNIKMEILKINTYQNKEVLMYTIIMLLSVLFIAVLVELGIDFLKDKFSNKEKDKKTSIKVAEEKELFEERKEDLKRLEKYLKDFNIVGIDGDWGGGKSFLTDHLEGYIKIKIDLLACNEDDIQIVVLNELDKLLKNQRIFSSYSPKLKKILRKERFFENIGDVLVNDDTLYSDVLTGLAKDLDKIDGTILIIYEDLDRVEDANVIKKILGISEKISSRKVKILHQFSGKNLKLKGINRDYLEKYIPFILNITEIKFNTVLKYLLATEKYKILESVDIRYEDFYFLQSKLVVPYAKEIYAEDIIIKLTPQKITIRRMEHFLDEIISIIFERKKYTKNKKEVITILFIKHFFEEIYNHIIPGERLIDTFLINKEGEKYTIMELMKICEIERINIANILKNPVNEKSVFILSIFDYDIHLEKDDTNSFVKVKENLITIEEKDRIIWSIVNSGKSEYTDYENAVNRFMNEVIDAPKDEQNNNYKKLRNDFYHDNGNLDNKTIERMGIHPMISLFQAINIVGIEDEKWKLVIEFCFEYYNIESINLDVIESLIYCNLKSKNTYIFVLEKFNKLCLKGNLNNEEKYILFLKKYLRGIDYFGFIDIYYEECFVCNSDGKLNDIEYLEEYVFKNIKERLERRGKELDVECINKDIETIIEFINHNINLIKEDYVCEVADKIEINMSINSNNKLDKEFKEKVKNISDNTEFNRKIEEGYITEKLSIGDIEELKRNR